MPPSPCHVSISHPWSFLNREQSVTQPGWTRCPDSSGSLRLQSPICTTQSSPRDTAVTVFFLSGSESPPRSGWPIFPIWGSGFGGFHESLFGSGCLFFFLLYTFFHHAILPGSELSSNIFHRLALSHSDPRVCFPKSNSASLPAIGVD